MMLITKLLLILLLLPIGCMGCDESGKCKEVRNWEFAMGISIDHFHCCCHGVEPDSTCISYTDPFISNITLPMKIDTVRVDTDTIGFDYIGKEVHISADEYSGCWMTLMGCPPSNPDCNYCITEGHYKIDSVWQPIVNIKYTTDTTYYLTPEQVEWLKRCR